MNTRNDLDDIFSQLNSEHQLISEFLVYFEKLNWMLFNGHIPDKILVEKSFYLITNYIQGFHHSKEEDVLFPEAFKNNVRKNGPECTKFFQQYLDNQFLEKFQIHRKNYEIPDCKHTQTIQMILDANSPLAIPISEHEAGHYAVQLMKTLWAKICSGEVSKAKEFSRFGRWYLEMIRSHINKEENCLFISLKKIFSPEQIKALNKASAKINQKFSSKETDINEIMAYMKNNTEL